MCGVCGEGVELVCVGCMVREWSLCVWGVWWGSGAGVCGGAYVCGVCVGGVELVCVVRGGAYVCGVCGGGVELVCGEGVELGMW